MDEREQQFLVCRQCGEAFHPEAIDIAADHVGTCGSDQGFDIQPESEAF